MQIGAIHCTILQHTRESTLQIGTSTKPYSPHLKHQHNRSWQLPYLSETEMAPIDNYDYHFPYFPLPPPHNPPSPPKVTPPHPSPSPPNVPPSQKPPPSPKVSPPHNVPSSPRVSPPHNPIAPPPSFPKPGTPPYHPFHPPPSPSAKPPSQPISPPPSPTVAPPHNTPTPQVAPPHHPITPPPPLPIPGTPPNHPPLPPTPAAKPPSHPIYPPPPQHPIPPPSPPHFVPPPPPTPAPGHHSTAIVIVFVSLGGLFFLAFLSVALCCFIKKRMKRIVRKTEIVDFEEHMRVQEAIVPGPHGEQTKVLTIEEDVHIVEKIKKNEKISEGSHIKSSHEHSQETDFPASSFQPTQNYLEHKV